MPILTAVAPQILCLDGKLYLFDVCGEREIAMEHAILSGLDLNCERNIVKAYGFGEEYCHYEAGPSRITLSMKFQGYGLSKDAKGSSIEDLIMQDKSIRDVLKIVDKKLKRRN